MEEFCWIPICNPELFVESKDCLLLRIRSVNDTSELCLLARLLCLCFLAMAPELSLYLEIARLYGCGCMGFRLGPVRSHT